MGVALAIVAAVKGYKCIFTIPAKMSIEKIRRPRAFGAEVVVTPTAVPPESPQSYYSVARRLADEIPGRTIMSPRTALFDSYSFAVILYGSTLIQYNLLQLWLAELTSLILWNQRS